MKKVMSLMIACLFLVSLAGQARANDLAADSQLQISVDHFFGDQQQTVSGYAAGIFMFDLNSGWPILFGYGGPVIKAGKVNIYPLLMTMNDPSGWSVGPSLWLEYVGNKNYLFTEYDYYVPFLATSHDEDAALPPHAYYSLSEYSYSLKDKMRLGADLEIYGLYEESSPQEFAYGPFVQMDRFKLWLFYNETPNLAGDNYLGLRFKISI